DVRLSARKGVLIVRSGKGDRHRELPVHPELRANLAIWLDERPDWPGATANPALFLNRRGGRLTTRGARDVLVALAVEAHLGEEHRAAEHCRELLPAALRDDLPCAHWSDGGEVWWPRRLRRADLFTCAASPRTTRRTTARSAATGHSAVWLNSPAGRACAGRP